MSITPTQANYISSGAASAKYKIRITDSAFPGLTFSYSQLSPGLINELAKIGINSESDMISAFQETAKSNGMLVKDVRLSLGVPSASAQNGFNIITFRADIVYQQTKPIPQPVTTPTPIPPSAQGSQSLIQASAGTSIITSIVTPTAISTVTPTAPTTSNFTILIDTFQKAFTFSEVQQILEQLFGLKTVVLNAPDTPVAVGQPLSDLDFNKWLDGFTQSGSSLITTAQLGNVIRSLDSSGTKSIGLNNAFHLQVDFDSSFTKLPAKVPLSVIIKFLNTISTPPTPITPPTTTPTTPTTTTTTQTATTPVGLATPTTSATQATPTTTTTSTSLTASVTATTGGVRDIGEVFSVADTKSLLRGIDFSGAAITPIPIKRGSTSGDTLSLSGGGGGGASVHFGTVHECVPLGEEFGNGDFVFTASRFPAGLGEGPPVGIGNCGIWEFLANAGYTNASLKEEIIKKAICKEIPPPYGEVIPTKHGTLRFNMHRSAYPAGPNSASFYDLFHGGNIGWDGYIVNNPGIKPVLINEFFVGLNSNLEATARANCGAPFTTTTTTTQPVPHPHPSPITTTTTTLASSPTECIPLDTPPDFRTFVKVPHNLQ